MGGTQRGEMPADLARAQARFEAWRRRRSPGTRIPELLWDLAVELTGSHGVSRTATALKLDYYSLKRRAASAKAPPQCSAPTFVELPAAVPAVACGRECVIELDDGTGLTLRMQLKGYEAGDIAAVGLSLRSEI